MVLASVCILYRVCSLQSATCILYLVCILYPVYSLQSAVCILYWPVLKLSVVCLLLGRVGDRVINHVRIQFFPVQQNAQQEHVAVFHWSMHNRKHVPPIYVFTDEVSQICINWFSCNVTLSTTWPKWALKVKQSTSNEPWNSFTCTNFCKGVTVLFLGSNTPHRTEHKSRSSSCVAHVTQSSPMFVLIFFSAKDAFIEESCRRFLSPYLES